MSLIPDTTVSFLVSALVFRDLAAFFWILFSIWGFYLFTWVKVAIWSWITFKISISKELAEQVFYYLKKNGFPEPADHEDSALGYLERVMSDAGQTVDLRIKAACEYATLNGYFLRDEAIMFRRMSAAYEDGIERYKVYFPSISRQEGSQFPK